MTEDGELMSRHLTTLLRIKSKTRSRGTFFRSSVETTEVSFRLCLVEFSLLSSRLGFKSLLKGIN